MTRLKSYWLAGSALALVATGACAKTFTIAPGELGNALNVYQAQSGLMLVVADNAIHGVRTAGVKGELSDDQALVRLLTGTGFTYARDQSGVIAIVPQERRPVRVAQAAPHHAPAMPQMPATVETVVVTAQHKSENIQQVPIAVTALSQQQLTERQVAGGPDLVKEVPNLTFSKTNFSGYNLEIRGIGTQAISVTTDPAVAIAFNDIPFIRNHFFEQEFFDLGDLEVLRGPQGTLYGRNATAGVVNIKSAVPTDSYEAMLSADIGNYNSRRYEGMLNLPIVGDTLDLRIAGEWTKRDGYTEDTTLNTSVDGRDLWSGRITLGWKPASNVQTYLVWEHFSEDDDRLRSGKQLCKTAPNPSWAQGGYAGYDAISHFVSQGCEDTSLYSPTAFEVPNGQSLTYYFPLEETFTPIRAGFDPYSETTQSTNLRDIQSAFLPKYRAKNDTLEYNLDWSVSPSLTFTSQTGYNRDFLSSTEDYDRFDSAPGAFVYTAGTAFADERLVLPDPEAGKNGVPNDAGIFCDPQLGCSDRLVLQDLSTEHAWQLSQEFRLASSYNGPLNFTAGANVLHYETEENYYVFVNSLSLFKVNPLGGQYVPGVTDNAGCLVGGYRYTTYQYSVPDVLACNYVDPNPLTSVNNEGHNYFLSQNPYVLNSYAAFGEVYYTITNDLKSTTGLRFTDDQKHFDIIPSELLVAGYGYPETSQTNQQWDKFTGREVIDWTPDLPFTDKSLFYASYAHGYKAGGANPPGAFYPSPGITPSQASISEFNPVHPLAFKPEFIEAFELGTKNALLGNSLTINGDVFYYNYSDYQISEIIDRTAINNNYDAHVEGAELETNWEPIPGLKFGLAQGLENTALAGGDEGVDLMDRTAGVPGWMVVKPALTESSNCILPIYVVQAFGQVASASPCPPAYQGNLDPVTGLPYVPNPTTPPGQNPPIPAGYPGFDPNSVDPNAPLGVNNGLGLPPNNGQGFDKRLGGHQLPNAPHFTTSLTAEYTTPVSDDWAATLHGDFYWQSQSWARVFEDAIDKIHGYSNVNLSLILTSANGWQVMGYVKNVFNTTAITGTFLNSDDSGLTTNVFLTDPRLFGVRVTKQLDQSDGFWGSDYSGYDFFTGLFSDSDNGSPPLWIELGGQLPQLDDGRQMLALPFTPNFVQSHGQSPAQTEEPIRLGFDEEAKLSFQPDQSDWVFSGAVQFGRTHTNRHQHLQTANKPVYLAPITLGGFPGGGYSLYPAGHVRFADTQTSQSTSHSIIDFLVGKDVGLGMPGASVVSGGVRVAQFVSRSSLDLHAEPDVQYPTNGPLLNEAQKYQFEHTPVRFHDFAQSQTRKESFHGLGPRLDWNASVPVAGNDTSGGQIALDWGASFAVLFGRQTMTEQHSTVAKSYYLTRFRTAGQNDKNRYKIRHGQWCANVTGCTVGGSGHAVLPTAQHTNRAIHGRSRMVAVPNVGAMFGVSYKYNNAKISFGYRADEFFGAMDGGIDNYKSYNRGFFGPYANISIGLGG